MLIDTHAHIFSYHFENDLNEVISRCKNAGIERIYMPNIDSGTIEMMIAVEEKYKGFCFSMIGLHPCSVKENFVDEMKKVEYWLNKRKFSAIGEIGTDLYWDKTYLKEQKKAFLHQAELAIAYDLPIVIHCRDSMDLTIDLVRQKQNGSLTGIFHCFTGNIEQAKKIIDLGFLIGLGGVVTFKNSNLGEVVQEIDLSNVVLETDSPYLAPTPYRGKRNEPAFIRKVLEKVTELKQVEETDVIRITGKNALNLFKE